MAQTKGIPLDLLIDTWLKHSGCNRATARELGCDNSNVIKRIRSAYEAGDERIDPKVLFKNTTTKSQTMEAVNLSGPRAWHPQRAEGCEGRLAQALSAANLGPLRPRSYPFGRHGRPPSGQLGRGLGDVGARDIPGRPIAANIYMLRWGFL